MKKEINPLQPTIWSSIITTLILLAFSLVLSTNKEFATLVGSSIFKILQVSVPTYSEIYGYILGYSLRLSLPSLLILISLVNSFSYRDYKTSKVVSSLCTTGYFLFTIIGLVLFYLFSKELYGSIPVIKPEDVKDYGLPFIKNIISFFDFKVINNSISD